MRISDLRSDVCSSDLVAIVIDGVTLSSVKPFNQDLFDIQQIEVLKGPQSALYGRNAAAGAIVITTKRPSDTLGGKVVGAVGNHDTQRSEERRVGKECVNTCRSRWSPHP